VDTSSESETTEIEGKPSDCALGKDRRRLQRMPSGINTDGAEQLRGGLRSSYIHDLAKVDRGPQPQGIWE
jgi:hypothetical protein